MNKLITLLLALVLCPLTLSAQGKRYHGDGIDNVLEYVPLVATFTLKGCGVESASSWKRLAVDGAFSIGLTAGTINDMRPDRTDNHGFPSGHTAVVFCGARMLDKEFRHVSPWISVAGYTVATVTAVDRVRRNRHHWDDVVVGGWLLVGR